MYLITTWSWKLNRHVWTKQSNEEGSGKGLTCVSQTLVVITCSRSCCRDRKQRTDDENPAGFFLAKGPLKAEMSVFQLQANRQKQGNEKSHWFSTLHPAL